MSRRETKLRIANAMNSRARCYPNKTVFARRPRVRGTEQNKLRLVTLHSNFIQNIKLKFNNKIKTEIRYN